MEPGEDPLRVDLTQHKRLGGNHQARRLLQLRGSREPWQGQRGEEKMAGGRFLPTWPVLVLTSKPLPICGLTRVTGAEPAWPLSTGVPRGLPRSRPRGRQSLCLRAMESDSHEWKRRIRARVRKKFPTPKLWFLPLPAGRHPLEGAGSERRAHRADKGSNQSKHTERVSQEEERITSRLFKTKESGGFGMLHHLVSAG